MPRRLVVCCDGTWNSPAEPTNVFKFSQGVVDGALLGDARFTSQEVFYEDGVGVGVGVDWKDHWMGGAFGRGLGKKVRECYSWVVDHYEPGDALYFVGFSRGAFTVRSTIGLINNCGILRTKNDPALVDEAYARYRSRKQRDRPGQPDSKRFRDAHSHEDRTIRFVGVWDTVGALGIPMPGLPIPRVIKKRWGFHDETLNEHIDGAYQALAIDERRRSFKPSLWKQETTAPQSQKVEQVWFAGCHRDVGGGEAVPDLSEIALLWMVDRAMACDLAFKPGHFSVTDSPGDSNDPDTPRGRGELVGAKALTAFNNSRTGLYTCVPPYRRKLGGMDLHRQPTAEGESVASSAQTRLTRDTEYGKRSKSLAAWLAGGKGLTAVTFT
jgi:uncharacterized protein (DUF2235 family)